MIDRADMIMGIICSVAFSVLAVGLPYLFFGFFGSAVGGVLAIVVLAVGWKNILKGE